VGFFSVDWMCVCGEHNCYTEHWSSAWIYKRYSRYWIKWQLCAFVGCNSGNNYNARNGQREGSVQQQHVCLWELRKTGGGYDRFEATWCLCALNMQAVWFSKTPTRTVSQVRRSQYESPSIVLQVSDAPGTSGPVSTRPVLRFVTASRHWGRLWIHLAARRRDCECERVTCRFHGIALSAPVI